MLGRNFRLLNLATYHPLYKARINRTYLGASNVRRVPKKGGAPLAATRPVENDDIPLDRYLPYKQGGPLHVIVSTLNETRSGRSNLEQRDRKGLIFAVGPAGISVSRYNHALWTDRERAHLTTPSDGAGGASATNAENSRSASEHGFRDAKGSRLTTTARAMSQKALSVPRRMGHQILIRAHEAEPRELRPLKGEDGYHALTPHVPTPTDDRTRFVECLTVGGWTAVSGAAVSTGLGPRTGILTSMLCGLANFRLGYWWDSQVTPWERRVMQDNPVFRAIATLSPVYAHLAQEMTGRFYGPNRRLWHLTDGGHFENTGAFELIRRRLPLIVINDCGMDPSYTFSDLGNLIRKCRADLGAEIRVLGTQELDFMFGAETALRAVFGEPSAFRKAGSSDAPQGSKGDRRPQALFAWVFYDGVAATHRVDDYSDAALRVAFSDAASRLIILKPTLSGDEPVDVGNYGHNHPSFPQQGTADQFFDEAQWESYRMLGEHIGKKVFAFGTAPFTSPREAERLERNGVESCSAIGDVASY